MQNLENMNEIEIKNLETFTAWNYIVYKYLQKKTGFFEPFTVHTENCKLDIRGILEICV